ncbi:MAG: hypothetical protein AAFV88_12045 [Planctomycetota bacterium]
MKSAALWLLWLVLPVFGLVFHYGPGQAWLARDHAANMIRDAKQQSQAALQAQDDAYQSQLVALSTRREAFVAGVDWQTQPQDPLAKSVAQAISRQDKAYERAADLWDQTAELYRKAADELLKVNAETSTKSTPAMSADDLNLLESLRWAEARAMVRSGEVFNGIAQLDALLTFRLTQQKDPVSARQYRRTSSLPMDVIREELAAAQYVGARLLREEGRPPEVWRPVANASRQHYRYLTSESDLVPQVEASVSTTDGAAESLGRLDRFQRNLEQVLNLEQSVTDQLQGIPLPRSAPLARRPGDGEPGNGKQPGRGPGRGPVQDGPPNIGAGIPGPMGRGW